MLLSKRTTIELSDDTSNIVGHLCYAASKLWNVCNYERKHYKDLGLENYPNFYYQETAHKDNFWYKNLHSQSAQSLCRLLDESWKSFYALQKSGGIENPKPPKFKREGIPVTYIQNGMKHDQANGVVRLSLSKQLKSYMKDTYDIKTHFLYLASPVFAQVENIKQIRIYRPKNGRCVLIVVHEVPDVEILPDNERALSIDLGLHNLMTCYDNQGKSFILGRNYLDMARQYDKEIARVQSRWATCQSSKGVKYPKSSKHLSKLYSKKKASIKDYLHKLTRYIVNYCLEHDIRTVIIGDIRHIRDNANFGAKTNQKLHSLPYDKIYNLLAYKLALVGIRFQKQEESYSSQCSPKSEAVSKKYSKKSNRKERGLYVDGSTIYNADSVGAYNIMRKFVQKNELSYKMPIEGLSNPSVVKVAV